MPFGFKNAPFAFSKRMADILHGCDQFAVPYLDDVAIYSNSWEKHLSHLNAVMSKIYDAGLTIKPIKCKFVQDRAKYLGHIIMANEEQKVQGSKLYNLKGLIKNDLSHPYFLFYLTYTKGLKQEVYTLAALLDSDRRHTIRELARETGLAQTTVLHMQKWLRYNAARNHFERCECEREAFLRRIIRLDET
ncbi:hypothetical protein AVEN_198435-1 [Araneus ventricosus]|uniref:Reverse transcriptase domain-containing protein n=1 Tax=Araneus ventricosus TaxID=182803 RepID=A0A4Y2RYN0_ARAVE|nr:hypothetical protein AVEN_198435-1 [Araneus ventricosus]